MKTLLILLVMLSPLVATAGDNKKKEDAAIEVVEQHESIRTTEYIIIRFYTDEQAAPEGEGVAPTPLRWSPPVEAHLHYPFLLIKDEKLLDNTPK
jgi:hypothetical protein